MLPLRDAGIEQTVVDYAGAPPPTQQRVSATQTLTQLTEEYVVFTPALLYALIPLGSRDPLADYVALNPDYSPPTWLVSPLPMFRGLTGVHADWNHRIGLLPRASWLAFRQFFGCAVYTGPDGLYRARWQRASVDDVLVQARATHYPQYGWPQVELHVLCVDSDRFVAYLRGREFCAVPRAYADTRLFSKTWQEAQDNPYGAIEQAVENATGATPDEQRYNRAVAAPWLQQVTNNARAAFVASLKQLGDVGGDPAQ